MAVTPQRKRKTAKKRQTNIKPAPPASPPPAPTRPTGADSPQPQILDLTGAVGRRPTVRLDQGDFKMLLPEELTFTQFSEQTAIGKRLIAIGDDVSEPGVLEELQELVVAGVRAILVGMDDAAAQQITPGQFLRISSFFKMLGDEDEATPSADGSSNAPGANDSSEVSEAA